MQIISSYFSVEQIINCYNLELFKWKKFIKNAKSSLNWLSSNLVKLIKLIN